MGEEVVERKSLTKVGKCFVTIFFSWIAIVGAQTQQKTPTTDPNEARIINTMFAEWGLSAEPNKGTFRWNISGEICSGAATDGTEFTAKEFNPAIKCDCSFSNNTICRITQLKVYAMDAVGVIPDGLWNLTRLFDLNLAQNYLTGPISASIGNLVRMQYLTFGINALSGKVPKELGKLTDLRSLSFGTNNFSGTLPSELGSLTKLEQMQGETLDYKQRQTKCIIALFSLTFFISGVSGEIPQTFANLQSLHTVWASDTNLTRRIPDFIGNWSKLKVLRFQGNSFEGPIPDAFSNLTSLTDLRISDLSSGRSSLDFIRDMKSLTTLILRNNNISGPIPSNIGEYRNLILLFGLQQFDWQIPNSLFNISLTHLFLGSNKLNGTLPAQKSPSLLNIDLSYNELSGTFPPWISQQNIQINLVANNFTIESSSSSSLPSGLNCLQRGFPCNRGSPRYSRFAVKCGGPEIKTSEGTVYERDNETLGLATYQVTASNRWAVSNVGLFAENNNATNQVSTSSQATNTLDSELFQTARISAGSLRYYGLGLENGNYTVRLQFAEIVIPNPPTWKSLGRRVFDIFIQGNLVLKDFDMHKETGGVFLRAVSKDFTIQVSENYLEIHLFWAGKGTCCVPAQGTYGPSISAVSAISDFPPTVSDKPPGDPPTKKDNKTGMIVGIVFAVSVTLLSVFLAFFLIKRRKKRDEDLDEDEEFLGMNARPYTFSYFELKTATDEFNLNNKLGEGGFGPVYKGTLADVRLVAVKQLSVASHQGKSQFVAEIATISAVQHRNLVKLYGCCIEGAKRLLVYEYLVNKSLDQALFGNRSLSLDWTTRYEICLGVARGLTYLHEESQIRIVHRDVKASNILLDSDLTPKISDFGLAKLYDDKKTHISTRVAGTIGYLAPEYAMRGHLTEKADVFGFGVVALELVSGRSNSDSSLEEDKVYLLEWAWQLHEDNREVEIVDPSLSEFNVNEVKRLIDVALLCTQTSPALRPPMSRVVAMLLGDAEVSRVTSKPGYLTDWKFKDTTMFMSRSDSITKTDQTHFGSSSYTSMLTDQNNTPVHVSDSTMHEIVGEGR